MIIHTIYYLYYLFLYPIIIPSSIVLSQIISHQCSCNCCSTYSGCIPTVVGQATSASCTTQDCQTGCRQQYSSQCTTYGQVQATCLTPTFNCQCNCCRGYGCTLVTNVIPSGSASVTSFSCDIASCTLACASKLPYYCPTAELDGKTQGQCTGQVTTTSTTTLPELFRGNNCTCACCSSGYFCATSLTSTLVVGFTSATSCQQCTQECMNKFTNQRCVSSSYPYGQQLVGVCTNAILTTNPGTGQYRCQCNCCPSSGGQCQQSTVNSQICSDSACTSQCIQTYGQAQCANTNGQTIGQCIGGNGYIAIRPQQQLVGFYLVVVSLRALFSNCL